MDGTPLPLGWAWELARSSRAASSSGNKAARAIVLSNSLKCRSTRSNCEGKSVHKLPQRPTVLTRLDAWAPLTASSKWAHVKPPGMPDIFSASNTTIFGTSMGLWMFEVIRPK